MEELRKPTINLSQDIQSLGKLPEYEGEMLPAPIRR
jgi:hypothetical protein